VAKKSNEYQVKQFIDHLDKTLSIENAAIERLTTRIEQTPIQDIKQRLVQHLKETHKQKSRLVQIISILGKKPDNIQANSPQSVAGTSNKRKNTFQTTADYLSYNENFKDGLNSSIPEEIELIKIKQDFIREYDELVAYNTLLHIAEEIPDLSQNDIIKPLKETIQEEESMVYWFQVHAPVLFDTLWPKLINSPIKRSQLFLLKHTGLRVPLIITYADIVGSTKMSMNLSVEDLVFLIRAFTFEISNVVESYGGYVLKYSGDAVISFFPFININDNKHQLSKKSVECAKSVINVIKKEINSILNEKYGYPEILVKIGIDEGENAVIQYGYEKDSPIDVLGYSMNVASKITSLTAPNSISIGENLYNLLDYELQSEFRELPIPSDKWKYINRDTKKSYRIYIQR
jgi:adenylate cyclase